MTSTYWQCLVSAFFLFFVIIILGVIHMKLHKINNLTDLFKGGTNSGIFHLSETEIMIIDPGLSESRGKRFVEYAEKNNKIITHVVTTHEHSDHIGALKGLLQESNNFILVADRYAVENIEHPDTFLAYINGGAPNNKLRGFFRKIDHETTVELSLDEGNFNINHHQFEWLHFGGHSIGSGALITPDKVLFLGDTLIPSEILTKFKLPLIYDVDGQYKGFEKLKSSDYRYCVTGHGRSVLTKEECILLVEENKQVLDACIELIKTYLKHPLSLDTLMSQLVTGLTLELNYKEYLFGRSSLSSMLSYLIDREEIDFALDNGQLHYYVKN